MDAKYDAKTEVTANDVNNIEEADSFGVDTKAGAMSGEMETGFLDEDEKSLDEYLEPAPDDNNSEAEFVEKCIKRKLSYMG